MLQNTNAPGYVIDSDSGAIINDNEEEWQRFKAQRDVFLALQTMQNEIDKLNLRIKQLEERLYV